MRWVARENLHITLWFIGEAADPEREAICAALANPNWSIPVFSLSLAGCGAFPPSGQPRVLWIGVREGMREMQDVYADLATRLAPLGYEPERRPYAPHLTIGRVKEAGGGASRVVRPILGACPARCGSSPVRAITLFRSRLCPKGAAYDAVLRVPLS